jgi:hypothetical protein
MAGCSTLHNSLTVAVQIPRDCEDLARPVPYPSVAVGMNAKVSLARHRAALGQANTNLVATRDCQKQQREHFAGGQ